MNRFFPCKYKRIKRVLKKLGLFVDESGSKHTLAKCIDNGRKTTIPRHKNKDIKPEIVRNIINFLTEKNFNEEDIVKLLR